MSGRSPSRGAWIEIQKNRRKGYRVAVAPPRGERGLKLDRTSVLDSPVRRSPSRGAWIEILCTSKVHLRGFVAPPRGERGLKSPNF